MSQRCAHVPNLPLFAFVEDKTQPRLVPSRFAKHLALARSLGVVGAQPLAVIQDAALQSFHRLFIRRAKNQREVLFFMFVTRVRQAVRELAVIGQKKHSFAHQVEAPRRK
jgi:hypothetical protein